MKKEEIEKKLAELMDKVSECEGLIAADLNGKVLVGQTLVELDHSNIAKSCVAIIKDSNGLGKEINKGDCKTTTLELENGYIIIVGSEKLVLIGIAGIDAKESLALLKRNLISISRL